MESLGNLKGTLMNGDIKLVTFECVDGFVNVIEIHNDDRRLYPAEFNFKVEIPFRKSLQGFLEYRQTPRTRIGLDELLREVGIKSYNWEDMFKYNKGRDPHDNLWVDCEDFVPSE